MSGPFSPPEGDGRGPGSGLVVGLWSLVGGAVALSLGLTGRLVDRVDDIAAVTVVGAVVGAVAGYGAYTLERRQSRSRPGLVDVRGRIHRPARAWVMAVPVALGALALLWLVVVASVWQGSAVPGGLFLLLALGAFAALRPLWLSQRLAQALEDVERGQTRQAAVALASIAAAWWATNAARDVATLNLGFLALRQRQLDKAEALFRRAAQRRVRGHALTALALVLVARSALHDADVTLREAMKSRRGRVAQAEIDGVRMVLLLRREGAAAVVELGQRLRTPEAGALFLGTLAVAYDQVGRASDAEEVLAGGVLEALASRGLDALLPELSSMV